MKLTDTITPSKKAVARQVGEETVILHLGTGTYFGLDPVGARIWQLISEQKTLTDVCTVMLEEYDMAREDLERDVLSLAEDFASQQLIDTG